MTLAQFPVFGFFFQDSRIGVNMPDNLRSGLKILNKAKKYSKMMVMISMMTLFMVPLKIGFTLL